MPDADDASSTGDVDSPAPLPAPGMFRRPTAHRRASMQSLFRRRTTATAQSLETFAGDDSVSGSDPHKTVQIGDLRFLNDADLPEGQSSILGRGSFAVVRLARRAVHQKSGSVVSLLSMDSARSTETGRTSRFFRDERLVAVKILDKALLAKSKSMARDGDDQLCVTTALDNVQCEIDVMRRLSHPNIIGLDEVIDRGTGKLFVVLDYAALGEVMSPVPGGGGRYARRPAREGEPALAGVVDPGRHFDERTAALLFVDVLHGLAHLHARRVVHRDLKPENILLDSRGIAKIGE